MSFSEYYYKYIIFLLILFHLIILVITLDGLSLSYKEVNILIENTTFIGWISNFFMSIFGKNDIVARIPFLIFYAGSALLMYLLMHNYFKNPIDRFITLAIFMILPGVNSAALLINSSIVVIFCILLYLYLRQIMKKEIYPLLVLLLFIDNSFAIFFLALFFYALHQKNNRLLIVSLLLFGISMSIYGFEVGGRPRGYLIDTFTMFASIFSPMMFLYFFYSIYRIGLKKEKDILWFISVTALILALLLSIRQKIDIADFAPFVVISLPIMIKYFLHSYRVRLDRHRSKHRVFITMTLLVLALNFFILIFNKMLYIVLDSPEKHFVYKHHIAKELSEKLKEKGIYSININNRELQTRLSFYGITKGEVYSLEQKTNDAKNFDILISYHQVKIAKYTINIKENK